MKKVIKKRSFFVIILCIISCGIGVYAANTYKATDIIYNGSDGNSISVNEALNELYNSQSNSSAKVYYLGTGTSYDLSKIDGYKNLTINNFLVELVNISDRIGAKNWSGVSTYDGTSSAVISKSYDSNTGKLTIGSTSGGFSTGGNVLSHSYSMSIKVYLVIGDIESI